MSVKSGAEGDERFTDQELNHKAFTERLRTLLDGRSARAFAQVAGVPTTTFNKIVNGVSEPTRPTLIAIARAAGVSLDWLVAGRGPMRLTVEPPILGSAPRLSVLASAISLVEEWLEENNRVMTPEKKADAAAKIYQLIMEDISEGHTPIDRRRAHQILRLVA